MSFCTMSFCIGIIFNKSRCAVSFGGGQVAVRLTSAPGSPSVENFVGCESLRPSPAKEISTKSNCGKSASDWIDVWVMRNPHTSNPASLTGGNTKYSGFGPPLEIETEAKPADGVVWR